jgi:hypothetical protein
MFRNTDASVAPKITVYGIWNRWKVSVAERLTQCSIFTGMILVFSRGSDGIKPLMGVMVVVVVGGPVSAASGFFSPASYARRVFLRRSRNFFSNSNDFFKDY